MLGLKFLLGWQFDIRPFSFSLNFFLELSHLNCQVAKLSLQTGFISEYTLMANLENDLRKNAKESDRKKEVCIKS